jgi:hypothetical protein
VNTLLDIADAPVRAGRPMPSAPPPGTPSPARPVAGLRPQSRVAITGTIRCPRTITVGSSPAYYFTLVSGTGELDVLFLGWPRVAGLRPGTRITVAGRVGAHNGQLTLWNPKYWIEPAG